MEIGIHQVILEGDSAIIVIALAEGDFGAATYGLFLKEADNFFLLILNCHTFIQRERATKSLTVWQSLLLISQIVLFGWRMFHLNLFILFRPIWPTYWNKT